MDFDDVPDATDNAPTSANPEQDDAVNLASEPVCSVADSGNFTRGTVRFEVGQRSIGQVDAAGVEWLLLRWDGIPRRPRRSVVEYLSAGRV